MQRINGRGMLYKYKYISSSASFYEFKYKIRMNGKNTIFCFCTTSMRFAIYFLRFFLLSKSIIALFNYLFAIERDEFICDMDIYQ